MKYYVIQLNITAKGSEDRDTKVFDTLDSALKHYHLIFSNGISAVQTVRAMLVDENLNLLRQDLWVAPEEATE